MNKKTRIFYIGNYIENGDISERNPILSPASTSKMKYIIQKLCKDYEVIVISPGFSREKKKFEEVVVEKENYKVIYLGIYGSGNNYLTPDDAAQVRKNIKNFIVREIKSEDKVILYSLLWLNFSVIKTLKSRKIDYILEVEEIYHNNKYKSLPYRIYSTFTETYSFKKTKKFIFASDTLKKKVNSIKSESCICYGDYKVDETKTDNLENKINILYTGSIDRERGIFLFLDALHFLGDYKNIEVNITGFFFGQKQTTIKREFELKINELKNKGLNINFLGTVTEIELREVMKDSMICVSPQIIENVFSSECFPSKIIKYLGAGKMVISSALPVVKDSPFAGYMYLYYKDDPKELMKMLEKAIKSKDEFYTDKSQKIKELIIELDINFYTNLRKLIEKEKN